MGKIAFLFPGQGSQYPGMGKDFFDFSPLVRRLYAQAEDLLSLKLSDVIFSGSPEDLRDTSVAQPAIFLTSAAVLLCLKEEGEIKPEAVAGHSLGEYSAVVSSGALSFSDAVKIVRKRGLWMAEASEKNPGAMAAIIGLDSDRVKAITEKLSVRGVISPANYNSPGQTVISGEKSLVAAAVGEAKEQGARQAVILNVSGPFHTSLMEEVKAKLNDILSSAAILSPDVPVVSNATAFPENAPEALRRNLINQVSQPVYWRQSMEKLWEDGFRTFVEIGPKKVLVGLLKQFPGFKNEGTFLNIEDRPGLEETARVLKGGVKSDFSR